MQRAISILVLALLGLACSCRAAAQPGNQTNSSSSIWLAYVGEHPILQQWNIHLEGQLFSYGAAERRELYFLRPGVRRNFSHGLSALLTYAYFAKDPAITNGVTTLPEHRISEDIQWRHLVVKDLALTHRLRAEQRFEAQEDQHGHRSTWSYAERCRYRLSANVLLPGNATGSRPDYLSIYDEVFVNFGPHTRRALDQNLAAGAIGWNVAPHLQFEIGYLLQYNPSATGIVRKYNHVIQVNLNSTIPFSRMKPSR